MYYVFFLYLENKNLVSKTSLQHMSKLDHHPCDGFWLASVFWGGTLSSLPLRTFHLGVEKPY